MRRCACEWHGRDAEGEWPLVPDRWGSGRRRGAMSERGADRACRACRPRVASLTADLAALGVVPGMALLVHSSLSALGWVSGGAQAVVLALRAAVGASGTLVMPTHSTDLTDPADVAESAGAGGVVADHPRHAARLSTQPPRRRAGWARSPTAFGGAPDVRRSDHPHDSFAAWGRDVGVRHGAARADRRPRRGLAARAPLRPGWLGRAPRRGARQQHVAAPGRGARHLPRQAPGPAGRAAADRR